MFLLALLPTSLVFALTLTLLSASTAFSQTVSVDYKHLLTWQDNADNEDGTEIERQQLDGTFAKIGQVGANITTYIDILSTGVKQCYRVRAFNASGFSKAYSNEACNLPKPADLTGLIDTSVTTTVIVTITP